MNQFLVLLAMFVGRTIFIKTLGAEYLGINGLYVNILTILSLAELGVGNVMIYSLYKPLNENDEQSIIGLLRYYKKIYRNIALSILGLGLLVLPFIQYFVDVDVPIHYLLIYFAIYLINSAASYLFIYKSVLINASQKVSLVNSIQSAFILLRESLQSVALIFTQSYTLYLLILLTSTILSNLVISSKANQLFPYLSDPSTKQIDSKAILEKIKSALIYKIGVVIMNNTDNILISVLIGTIYVGYYTNYMLIISVATTLSGIVIQSMFPSVGNLNSNHDSEKSYQFFRVILLFFHWMSALFGVGFVIAFSDVIKIWIGEEYILEQYVVLAISINFYLQNIINPVWIYRETMGLFNNVKYLMMIAAIINILLSCVFGLYFGLFGIIISTAIARLCTTVWYEPKLIFESKFNKPVFLYWKQQVKYFIISLISLGILWYLTSTMPGSFLYIVLKVLLCVIVVSVLFLLGSVKSDEFKSLMGYLKLSKS